MTILLGWLAQNIWVPLLEWGLQDIFNWIMSVIRLKKQEQQAQDQANQDSKAINDAQTTEDQTAATTKAAHDTFGGQ